MSHCHCQEPLFRSSKMIFIEWGCRDEGGLGSTRRQVWGFWSPQSFLWNQKKSGLPDLIHIDFRNNEESVLAFDLTPFNFEELQVSITQERNLVWIQTISVPSKRLYGQNLVTFVLTREALSAGEYKIKLDGNPSREIKRLGEFDLTIER